MKRYLSILIFALYYSVGFTQVDIVKTNIEFRDTLNEFYSNPETSPLKEEDQMGFTGLGFFPISSKFVVEADFIRTEDTSPFEMKTSTDRLPIYQKYGELHFTIDGQNLKLDIFQNVKLKTIAAYADYLFLPYKDLTNGDTSYGGGRFIDLKIPTDNKTTLDFNKSYNPYCAYNHKYSCPIPPLGNHLTIEINAGVLAPINDH